MQRTLKLTLDMSELSDKKFPVLLDQYSTVRHLEIEVDDALEIAEQKEV